ncbi:MAG: phosphatase PAP2 family protein [Mycobacteriales bacterium]
MSARTRLALGLVGIAATASLVRRDEVGPREVAVFRAVNDLPDDWYRPVWVVMQAGALGAAPVAAGVARAAGRPRLAGQLLAGGSCAWLLSKVLKRSVQRPRPVVLLPDTHCRGRDASGLGYVSGHAAVAVALAAAALPHLGPRGRSAVVVTVPSVGLARMYVGAHLPLDVLGGAALGVAVDAAVSLLPPGRGPARR